jgi:ketosteroid isomerase-like protein
MAANQPGLASYFEAIDRRAFDEVMLMLAPDFGFVALVATPDGDIQRFGGGLTEMRAYLESRPTFPRKHVLLSVHTEEQREVTLGQTEHEGQVLATFTAAASRSADGAISRLMSAVTPGLRF